MKSIEKQTIAALVESLETMTTLQIESMRQSGMSARSIGRTKEIVAARAALEMACPHHNLATGSE